MIEVMVALVILSMTLLISTKAQLWTQQRSQGLVEAEKLQWLAGSLKSLMLENQDPFSASSCHPDQLSYKSLKTLCSKSSIRLAFSLVCTSNPPNLSEFAIAACCPESNSANESTLCWLGLRWWQQQGFQQRLYSFVPG
jgi:Tfp pilus assembly protein PilV